MIPFLIKDDWAAVSESDCRSLYAVQHVFSFPTEFHHVSWYFLTVSQAQQQDEKHDFSLQCQRYRIKLTLAVGTTIIFLKL